MRPALLGLFLAMGVVTYLTRAPLLLILAHRRLPAWLERYFAALPIALLTALAVPLLLLADRRFVGLADGQMPAALLVAWLARRTGNLLLSVAAGVVVVAVWRALLS
jgi:branched-subunit amino acid transport protein